MWQSDPTPKTIYLHLLSHLSFLCLPRQPNLPNCNIMVKRTHRLGKPSASSVASRCRNLFLLVSSDLDSETPWMRINNAGRSSPIKAAADVFMIWLHERKKSPSEDSKMRFLGNKQSTSFELGRAFGNW
ncbi:hypothetical protein NMG60_11005316 [Bertholletia excelsa]